MHRGQLESYVSSGRYVAGSQGHTKESATSETSDSLCLWFWLAVLLSISVSCTDIKRRILHCPERLQFR